MQIDAVVLRRHGGPEVLERERIELPPPGPREVRVRVRAVAMNHMDLWVRRGLPGVRCEFPFRLGCDVAGVVEELGPGARAGAPGQRVLLQPALSCGVCRACLSGRDNLCGEYRILGEGAQGGYAEAVVVPDSSLVPIPDEMPFVDAAALPLCTLTAWRMAVRKAGLQPGQTVLVHAAGSGVSSVLVQIAKIFGARVLATAGGPEKVARARALGADEAIDYAAGDWVAEVKRLTGKRGADVVFDHVGGEVFEKSLLAVAWGGKIVTCGATAGFTPAVDLRRVFFRQVEILGSTMGSKGDLLAAMDHVRAGRIRPVVGLVLPLWEARAAHEALEARRVFGKVVMEVG